MPRFTDQLQNEINLNSTPKRIISLVPSQSEFLWDLGIKPVGITKFCIHPDQMFRTCERVGGTKTLDLEKIRQLKPDLIIGNREENELDQIQELQKEFPVWMSDIITLDDAIKMMSDVAVITGRKEGGQKLLEEITNSIEECKDILKPQSVLYFMWNDPYMVTGQNTFINSVLSHAGLINAAAKQKRYPVMTANDIKNLNPDLCFLSSEPFPFSEKHKSELQKILPNSKIIFVDGEMFSWYGSRLKRLSGYLKTLKEHL